MARLVVLLLVLLSAIRPAAALPVSTAAGNPTIVVGVIATLSGPGAMAGQDALDGFVTALRQMGGRFANQEVRVVPVDDRGSADVAMVATRRLLEREKVDFILTAVSRPAMAAIARPLRDSRLFILNLDAYPERLFGADCQPYLFGIATPPDAASEAVGVHFTNEKYARVVVIGPDTPQTDQAVAALRRTWAGRVVAVLKPRHGAATFAAEIKRLRELAPDAVLTLLGGGMGLAWVREYAAAGLKGEIPLLGTWSGFERPLLTAMDESGLDLLNVGPWSPDLDAPHNKRMISDFEQEYGRPATAWVAQGYDSALLLEAAMKTTQGRTSDREAVRNALRRAEFASVRGGFRFAPDHAPVINLYLRRVVRDAKGRLTNETRGILIKDWQGRDAAQCPMRWTEEAAKPGPAAPPASPAPKPAKPAKPPKPAIPPAAR